MTRAAWAGGVGASRRSQARRAHAATAPACPAVDSAHSAHHSAARAAPWRGRARAVASAHHAAAPTVSARQRPVSGPATRPGLMAMNCPGKALPAPIWARDRAGKLAWVSPSYIQAVEARDAGFLPVPEAVVDASITRPDGVTETVAVTRDAHIEAGLSHQELQRQDDVRLVVGDEDLHARGMVTATR